MDEKLNKITDIPYTISYVVKKRIQIDNFNELPKEKRPPEKMIWDGTSEEIDDFLDRVFDYKKSKRSDDMVNLVISDDEIEG